MLYLQNLSEILLMKLLMMLLAELLMTLLQYVSERMHMKLLMVCPSMAVVLGSVHNAGFASTAPPLPRFRRSSQLSSWMVRAASQYEDV